MLIDEILAKSRQNTYVPAFVGDLFAEVLLRENILDKKIFHAILPLEGKALKEMLRLVNIEKSLKNQLLASLANITKHPEIISFVCIDPRDVIKDGRVYGRYGFLCEQVPYMNSIDFVTAAMVLVLVAQQEEVEFSRQRIFLGKKFECSKGIASFLGLVPPRGRKRKWEMRAVIATEETSFVMDEVEFVFGIKCTTEQLVI